MVLGIALLASRDALAYVGPGAGIAVATTGLALLVSIVLAIVGVVFWPVRWLIKQIKMKRPPKTPVVDRAVIIGLDGLDPKLVDEFMAEGALPNLEKLKNKGDFQRLGTTFPAMSPVAWSSFATGVNPAKHGIFDFLTRDPKSYAPDLSSADVRMSSKSLNFGDYKIPLGKAEVKLLRKSRPFWEVLGNHQVPVSILRVPITFPPEKFYGNMLSAMCVPDLQGSQGSFTYFTSATDGGDAIGGARYQVKLNNGEVDAALIGPPNPMRKDNKPVELPFKVVYKDGGKARLTIGKKKIDLEIGEYTDWIPVAFPLALGAKLRGICRFRLLSKEPFKLYVTPINIDPENPILPISHPKFFSIFLAKLMGRFATLGLAEDTWALNEGVLDEDAFLEQAWANHDEREAMFFHMLKRTPKGLTTCVFDGSDRIQHMFMRFYDDGHPAMKEEEKRSKYKDVIKDTYTKLDTMVGKAMDKVDIDNPKNFFAVISDHGFQTFRRGVNINSWLLANGYLFIKDDAEASGEWFRGIDWERTKAFSVGLGGIFLNIEGRERDGIIPPSEANAMADELAEKLTGLVDPDMNAVCIQKCYASYKIYQGPYAEDAPDLIVGYSAGWRASWDGVRGIADQTIFDNNEKAWSGDHCIDPELVPGVLISNRKLGAGERQSNIADMAPTMLELFGIPSPKYMDGDSLLSQGAQASGKAKSSSVNEAAA